MPLDFNPEEESVPENENSEGVSYGPQSFDINDSNDHLFLLDSVNERVLEYDENGKYLKNFPIACGGTGDIRVSPDYKSLYIWSNRCGAIYKYDIVGEFLESYHVTPGKNPGIGNSGMAFDKNGNIMLDIQIEDYLKGSRFYQIGKNGDEWKENNYFGFISKDGKEYYRTKSIDQYHRSIQTLDVNGKLQKEFIIKLLQKAYVYYYGCDEKKNIYLNVAFEHRDENDGYYFDEFIWKYNKKGDMVSNIDVLSFLRKKHNVNDNKLLPDYSYAWAPINYVRVDNIGNIYYMFTFKNEGLEIFKYSKVK